MAHSFPRTTLIFVYLIQSAYSFAHSAIRLLDRRNRVYLFMGPNKDDERVISISLDSTHHCDDWHRYCEDVDKNMEGLVSPSPESFNALHRALVRANAATSLNIVDIMALSRYLVKPKYTIELFHDDEIVKWRMIQGGNDTLIYSNISTEEGRRELYHNYSTLQISQLALELATNATNHDANLLSNIQEVAYQAEVSHLPLTPLLCFPIGFMLNFFRYPPLTSVEANRFDFGYRLERACFRRCMLQFCPRRCPEFIKVIP